MARKRFEEAEIATFDAMDSAVALSRLGLVWKLDTTFVPRKSMGTSRVFVDVGAAVYELLVNGPKWYDTATRSGGVGAISLTQHLHQQTFVAAVHRLKRAGPQTTANAGKARNLDQGRTAMA